MKITEDKYIEILEIQGISYNKNSKWFTVSLERINEAINYTRCCKSDSEQLVCELCKKPLEKVTGIVCENTMCDRHR